MQAIQPISFECGHPEGQSIKLNIPTRLCANLWLSSASIPKSNSLEKIKRHCALQYLMFIHYVLRSLYGESMIIHRGAESAEIAFLLKGMAHKAARRPGASTTLEADPKRWSTNYPEVPAAPSTPIHHFPGTGGNSIPHPAFYVYMSESIIFHPRPHSNYSSNESSRAFVSDQYSETLA